MPKRGQERFLLAPVCWPLVAFGQAASIIFGICAIGVLLIVILAFIAGIGLDALMFFTPPMLVLGSYPGFCWVWNWLSRKRGWGLYIELEDRRTGTPANPYRALDDLGSYRVWYRGKVIEEGPIQARALAFHTYVFRLNDRQKHLDSVSWLSLKSQRSKAPVWWFAFAQHFERGAYVLESEGIVSPARFEQRVQRIQASLGLTQEDLPHHVDYPDARTMKRAQALIDSGEVQPMVHPLAKSLAPQIPSQTPGDGELHPDPHELSGVIAIQQESDTAGGDKA